MDERLVAVEQPVATGEQIALEPSLALVLRQHLHDPPVGGEVVVAVGNVSPIQARSVTSKTSWSRLEAVSSGPKSRKFVGLSADHVAEELAEQALVASRRVVPGAFTSTA